MSLAQRRDETLGEALDAEGWFPDLAGDSILQTFSSNISCSTCWPQTLGQVLHMQNEDEEEEAWNDGLQLF